MQPTVGRIVNYQVLDRFGNQRTRPAEIVEVFSHLVDDMVNLIVSHDGSNDGDVPLHEWKGSVHRSEGHEVGTWDWMDYQKGQAQKTEALEQELQKTKEMEDQIQAVYRNHIGSLDLKEQAQGLQKHNVVTEAGQKTLEKYMPQSESILHAESSDLDPCQSFDPDKE